MDVARSVLSEHFGGMKIFGTRLKQRAADLGISNAEAARRAGLDERRYANYTTEAREPNLETLAKIAKILETTPDHLLGFENAQDKGKRGKLLSRIASAARMLPDNELELVAVQLDALAGMHKKPPTKGK